MKTGESWLNSRQKRAMDMAIATAALPVGGVGGAMAAAALFGETPSRSPLFWQQRIGQSPDSFIAVPKLRTLRGAITNQSSRGYNHPEATLVGKVVRATHADEAPQLALVLKGDMSIVGPRPHVAESHQMIMDELSPREQTDYLWALSVAKPGIVAPNSYLQHISGSDFGDNAASGLATIEYAKTASFATDMRIMAQVAQAMAGNVLPGSSPERRQRDGTTLVRAAESFGVPITPEITNHFFAGSRLAGLLDEFVDAGDIPSVGETEQYMQDLLTHGVDGQASDGERLNVAIANLPPHVIDAWQAAKTLPLHAINRQRATDVSQLASALAGEAELFSSMFRLPLGGNHDVASRQFNNWLNYFSRGGYFVDSAVDMPSDYRQGRIGFVPTLADQLFLLRLGAKEGVAAMAGINPRTGYALGKTAMLTLLEGRL